MMTLRPGSLLRPTAVTLAALAFAATLLGRSAPRGAPPRGERRPAYPRYVAVDGDHFADPRDPPRVLDTETGRVARLSLPETERLCGLGCSPWVDGDGRFQLVGCWTGVLGDNAARLARSFGLARYAFPGGRAVEGWPCEVVPRGRLCWSPDRGDRVLFAAGDGRLYRCDLRADARDGGPAVRPRPIAWGELPPGVVDVGFVDPAWPSAGGLGGRVLVALLRRHASSRAFDGPRLWWLQLTPGGEAVEAAGRLIDPGESDTPATEGEERLPALVATGGGPSSLSLAYLRRRGDPVPWELWLASVSFDRATGTPRVPASACRKVAEGCLPLAPAFSPDGRWVYAWRPDAADGVRPERFAVNAPSD